MSKLKTLIRLLTKNQGALVLSAGRIGLLNWMPDKPYLRLAFQGVMGYPLNLKDPKTFNEKLQWLKLYDRRPEYTKMVDKYAVRKYIADTIGEECLIPLLGVWDDPDEIDFNALPDQFVLKCNHNSGIGLCICKDKSKLDIKKVKKELWRGLNQDYYLAGREWPYKNMPRKIIAEQCMVDESGYELKDYKFFCFNGEPKALFVATDRNKLNEEVKFDFYDLEWNHLPFVNGHQNANRAIPKPASFDKMIKIALVLSKGIPQVRVDLYDINGHVYFGELTFSHFSGFVPFQPEEWDYTFGSWLELPQFPTEQRKVK